MIREKGMVVMGYKFVSSNFDSYEVSMIDMVILMCRILVILPSLLCTNFKETNWQYSVLYFPES